MKLVAGDNCAKVWRQKQHIIRPLIRARLILALCILPLTGCGTTLHGTGAPTAKGVSLSASATTLLPQATAVLTVTPKNIPVSTISLHLSCNASQCGSLDGNVFIAPHLATLAPPLNVTVAASSTIPATQGSTVQFTIVPPPTITSISPRSVASGSIQPIAITGFGFNPSSTIQAELDKRPVQVTSIHVDAPTSITFSLGLNPGEAGVVSIQVHNDVPTSLSPPVDLYVAPPAAKGGEGLPVFNVSTYAASGSPQTFHCSGKAGEYTLICDENAIDFAPNQGVRVVSAGPNEQNPYIQQQPQLDRKGLSASGSHSYCYVVYATDALGGISAPSPQTCISGEPSLSYLGTYNSLAPPYRLPLSAFIWYVSEDGGPFQLFSVGMDAANDVGQRVGTRGGWPSSYPVGSSGVCKNEDFFTTVTSVSANEITLAQPLVSSVDEVEVDHDDTGAIQAAIDAAVSVGGGIVKIGDGTFNVRRPSFPYYAFSGDTYPRFTTIYSLKRAWMGYSNLYISNGATGNVFIEGDGASTILQTPPDFGGYGKLIAVGDYSNPAYPPYHAIKIEQVEKDGTSIVLSNAPQGVLHAGDDIWLYSGAFDPNPQNAPCVDSNGSAGGNCHFSELNSVLHVEGRVITLKYPTSKKFYDDGKDSFGLVKLPITPHNVGIENLTINTYNPVTGSGFVYGLLIDHVKINGFVNHGAFGGGFKRDVLIENSSWGLGLGDVSWYGTEEYDQFTNVGLINDTVIGHAAPGSEGPSLGARLYFTEGTSQVVIEGSTFDHVAILFQDTTDDIVDKNEFDDAYVSVGASFNPFPHPLLSGASQDASFLSFGLQETAEVNNNVFNIDSGSYPPWIISLGHFVNGQVDGNIIVDDSPRQLTAVVNSSGGEIKRNMITLGAHAISLWGIAATPDEGPGAPASSFDLEGNTINGGSELAGIYVVDSGFTNAAPMCITGNTINIQKGVKISVPSSTTNQTCAGSDQ